MKRLVDLEHRYAVIHYNLCATNYDREVNDALVREQGDSDDPVIPAYNHCGYIEFLGFNTAEDGFLRMSSNEIKKIAAAITEIENEQGLKLRPSEYYGY